MMLPTWREARSGRGWSAGPTDARHLAPVDARHLDDVTGGRCMHELSTTEVDADVTDRAVVEEQPHGKQREDDQNNMRTDFAFQCQASGISGHLYFPLLFNNSNGTSGSILAK